VPPASTARLARLRQDHPVLWAARHVAAAVACLVIATLGLRLLVLPLFGWIDLSWLGAVRDWVRDLRPGWLRPADLADIS